MRKLLFVPLWLLVGCVDPADDLTAFQNRIAHEPVDAGADVAPMDATSDVATDGPACDVHPGFVQGQFLLAISVSLLPTKPIVVLADVTTPAFEGGTGLALSAQPLAANDRSTPVDSPLSLGPFAVDTDGSFRADLPGLTVSGDANPITKGAAITADLVLAGNLCATEGPFCGNVSGQATKPLSLDLAGSTFTLTPIPEGGAIPLRPTIDCKGTLADPL